MKMPTENEIEELFEEIEDDEPVDLRGKSYEEIEDYFRSEMGMSEEELEMIMISVKEGIEEAESDH